MLASPELDAGRAYEHVRTLAEEIGPRVAGTAGEIAARDYIRRELESYGYDVTVQDFAFEASSFMPARIEVDGAAEPAFALDGSLAADAIGPLIDAGIGGADEFPLGAPSGAIALIQRGDLTFTEKVTNAQAAGAAGVIIYNSEPGRLLAALDVPAAIPAVSVSGAAGRALLDRLAVGPVRASVRVTPSQGTAFNVVAKPPGTATCETVTGAHYDSVAVGGTDDNASGTAATLELARVARARGLPGANCFVAFGAEELGLLGSRHFVAALTTDEISALRAMINLDVVGIAGDLNLIGSADLVDLARTEGLAAGIQAVPSELPPNANSDHASFLDASVPAVFLNIEDGMIHTRQDALDRIEPEALHAALTVAYGTLAALNRR